MLYLNLKPIQRQQWPIPLSQLIYHLELIGCELKFRNRTDTFLESYEVFIPGVDQVLCSSLGIVLSNLLLVALSLYSALRFQAQISNLGFFVSQQRE
jgi:hypothetical protein